MALSPLLSTAEQPPRVGQSKVGAWVKSASMPTPGLLAQWIRAQEAIEFVSFGNCGQAQQGLWPLISSTKQGFKQIVARHTLRRCYISQDGG